MVVTGTATAGCVFDTAVGAAANDYYTVVVRDCVTQNDSSGHQLGLEILTRRYDHPTASDLKAIWAQ